MARILLNKSTKGSLDQESYGEAECSVMLIVDIIET